MRYNALRVLDRARATVSRPVIEPSFPPRRQAATRAVLDLRTRAADTAVAVADRLADPATLSAISAASAHSLGVRDSWEPLSLTTGYPGVAILHAQTGDPDVAYEHLRAARHVDPGPATTSVCHGFGAFVAAVAVVARETGDYQQLLRQGERWLADTAVVAVRDQRERLARGDWLNHRQWNAHFGVAGPGRLLLEAVTDGRDEHLPALREVLELLVVLAQPRPIRPDRVPQRPGAASAPTRPGWWTPAADPARPRGAAELGAAYGICGPLALLALAGAADVWVAGQRDAIALVGDGLLTWRTATHRWPNAVFPNVYQPSAPDLADASWALGTAGIARALWFAGVALEDSRLCAAGVDALAALASQPSTSWPLQGPTVWHGRAGLLAVATRVAAESGSPAVIRLAEDTAGALLADYQDDTPWGFQNDSMAPSPAAGARDVPGLLVGAAGAALALREWADTPSPPHRPTPGCRSAAGPAWGLPLLID